MIHGTWGLIQTVIQWVGLWWLQHIETGQEWRAYTAITQAYQIGHCRRYQEGGCDETGELVIHLIKCALRGSLGGRVGRHVFWCTLSCCFFYHFAVSDVCFWTLCCSRRKLQVNNAVELIATEDGSTLYLVSTCANQFIMHKEMPLTRTKTSQTKSQLLTSHYA